MLLYTINNTKQAINIPLVIRMFWAH